jgi:glycosyltransferase involved in cell wall biosynthesis
MKLSVIICTHNPRTDYLRRVLDGLKSQTLVKEQWELLLVDNASSEPLAGKWDLSWHPSARHIREDQLGKTPALLRGIREASGNVLVVVDDDNVLAPEYLMRSLAKMREHPKVGVWNGIILPEFEEVPANWKQFFLPYLAINHEVEDRVSIDIESAPLPIGAGMVFRREVALAYVSWMSIAAPKSGVTLDRRGTQLFAGEEDTELGILAIMNGFACGRTPDLQMAHLMPRRRIATGYLFRIARDITYSHVLIFRRHGLQRGQLCMHELCSRLIRSMLLAVVGALTGNAHRFGRGMVGISSNYGNWLASRNR